MSNIKLKESRFEFHRDDRGFYYLRLNEGEEFMPEDISIINSFIIDKHDGAHLPFLIELGYGSTVSTDVQEYLTNGENRHSTADAILISTFAHKLISKFYLRRYKPAKPTKVFNTIFEALEWIEKQK